MTKTFGIVIALVLVIAVAALAGAVYAQSSTPQLGQPGSGYGNGYGMMGRGAQGGMMGRGYQPGAANVTPQPGSGYGSGYGMMGRGAQGGMMGRGAQGDFGIMHDEMVKAFAAKLGLTVEDVNTRLQKGESMFQIAQSKGLDATKFRSVMEEARTTALDALVKQGKLTQQQADLMKSRSAQMPMWGLDDDDNDGFPDCPMGGR